MVEKNWNPQTMGIIEEQENTLFNPIHHSLDMMLLPNRA